MDQINIEYFLYLCLYLFLWLHLTNRMKSNSYFLKVEILGARISGLVTLNTSNESLLKIFDPGQKIFLLFGSGRVCNFWKIFLIKLIFSIFCPEKSKKSVLSQKYRGRSWVDPLFTSGQKYAQIGSGQGPSQLVMGLGQKILTRVGSNFCCSGRVGSAIFGLGMDLENFP